MTTNFNFTGFTFYFIEHRNQQVIVCQFPCTPALIIQLSYNILCNLKFFPKVYFLSIHSRLLRIYE